jgi:hypothetical protein
MGDIFFQLTSFTYLFGIPFKLLIYSSTYLSTKNDLLSPLHLFAYLPRTPIMSPPTYLLTYTPIYLHHGPTYFTLIGQPNHSHQRWCRNKITCRYCKKLFNVFLTNIENPNENIKLILDVRIALAINSTTSLLQNVL